MTKNILCPVCRIPLQPVIFQKVEVDICVNGCRGIWLDAGELNRIKGFCTQDTELHAGKKTILNDVGKRSNQYKVMFCPRCKIDLDVQSYDASNIEVDKCLSCDGVWLNYGDLQKINELYERGWNPRLHQTALAVEKYCSQQSDKNKVGSIKSAPQNVNARKVLGAIFFVIDLFI